MKQIGRSTLVLFAVVFLWTLIVMAPATLLSKWVESASKGKFVLSNARGTLWQGDATPALRQRSGNLLALESLHWDVSVWHLLVGKAVVNLRWNNVPQAQPMVFTATLNQVEVHNLFLPLQADFMGELSPLLQVVQLSGPVHLRSEHFILNRQGMGGEAVAEWSNAGSVLSTAHPLGSYRLLLTGAGESLNINLSTMNGILLLEGSGNYSSVQGLQFQVVAHAAEKAPASLNELLNHFGPESSAGMHVLNLVH